MLFLPFQLLKKSLKFILEVLVIPAFNFLAIEPQLVYEETLHHQGYRVVLACKEQGITMKKLAEVLCIPYAMARSMIRYFDTNNIGRIITVDHLKLKLQKYDCYVCIIHQ